MAYDAKIVGSPVGALRLIAGDDGLSAILWPGDELRRVGLERARIDTADGGAGHPILDRAERQLAAYFAGTLTRFTVPLDPRGTPFQRSVWAALCAIPFGQVRSYADVARAIGRPGAARAVGAANGRNPLSILIPCHRLVGSDGGLAGFAGGLAVKARLLAFERDAAAAATARDMAVAGDPC